jgi:hypothetical protein
MPMNPEKFKRIITNHFKNVTPEEFLANLRKSSPYLFTETREEKDPYISAKPEAEVNGSDTTSTLCSIENECFELVRC